MTVMVGYDEWSRTNYGQSRTMAITLLGKQPKKTLFWMARISGVCFWGTLAASLTEIAIQNMRRKKDENHYATVTSLATCCHAFSCTCLIQDLWRWRWLRSMEFRDFWTLIHLSSKHSIKASHTLRFSYHTQREEGKGNSSACRISKQSESNAWLHVGVGE